MPVAVRSFLEPLKLLAPLQSQCGPVPLDTMQREAQRGFGSLTRGKRRYDYTALLHPAVAFARRGQAGLILARGFQKTLSQ